MAKSVIRVGSVYVNETENGPQANLRTRTGRVDLAGEALLKMLLESGIKPQSTVQNDGRPSWVFVRAQVTGLYDAETQKFTVTAVVPAPVTPIGDFEAFKAAVANAPVRPPRAAQPAAQPAPAPAPAASEPTMPF